MNSPQRALPLPLLLSALALSAALLFFYVRSSDYQPSSHFADVATLRQLKQVDADWEAAMLKARIGSLRNYDLLSPTDADMAGLPHKLETLASVPSAAAVPGLAPAILDYRQAFRRKLQLIEEFKTHHAVLRNSLAFLPRAAYDMAEVLPAAADTAIQHVLVPTLVYGEGGTEDDLPDVANAVGTLHALRSRLDARDGQRVDIFIAHVRTVMREAYKVNLLMQGFDAASTAPPLDRIEAILNTEQWQAARQAQRHRQLLLLFAAALAGLLLYAAWRLARSHSTIRRVNGQLRQANDQLETRVAARTVELESAHRQLQAEFAERCALESRVVQSEKLASIGQLAAGVAHEINNPLGFLSSNIGMLEQYQDQLFTLLSAYEAAEQQAYAPASTADLAALREECQVDFLRQDIPALLAQSRDGMRRVQKIVRSLKDFSRAAPSSDWIWADLHQGLDSTLQIIAGELRKVADVRREYGHLPLVQCLPDELNQVFLNLLVNAGHAIGSQRGQITIRTGSGESEAWIEVCDNGCGIAPEVLPRIFDPFYTTKAIGKGTGLGLSLSHGIVRSHGGRIEVRTAPGQGTAFRVVLPLRQAASLHREADACLNPA